MNTGFDASIPRSMELYRRAVRVIPGGIYGHTKPALNIPGIFPYYAESGSGCRYRDVDGREIIDFMCGYGPLILGFRHPEVEAAAAAQRRKGNVFNHPTPVMVELAERLVERIDFADWAVFGKNGSDMTTWAVQVAREATNRPKVVMVEGAYHGVDAWCTPGTGGVLPEDRAHVLRFGWNRLDQLDALFARFAESIAAVILTPFHHPGFGKSVLPETGFMKGVEDRCKRHGSVFILDDIRAGFRLHAGGSHRHFGFTPDIACYCKALANGYPISAAAGSDALREASTRVFLTGSYWNNADAMTACLACLDVIEREAVPEHLERMGERLVAGLVKAGDEAGYTVDISGPPATPYLTFGDDPDFFRLQRFCGLALREGVFFHPHHNWFLGYAHREDDIDAAVEAARKAFQRLAETDGETRL